VGPFGSGARLKLVANSMLAAVLFAAAELAAAGQKAGLEPATTFDVLERFAPMLGLRRAGFLEDRHEPTMFALRDLHKDLELALSLFQSAGAQVPLTSLLRGWVEEVAGAQPNLDVSAVVRRYASLAERGSERRGMRAVT
jgi:3-hydroxyisobutyrate dehydrogenase-like beta-hydroxyacid dehydrogenase